MKENESVQKVIDDIEKPERSVATILFGKDDVKRLAKQNDTREIEIEYDGKLADLLTVYLGHTCKQYKKEKLVRYE